MQKNSFFVCSHVHHPLFSHLFIVLGKCLQLCTTLCNDVPTMLESYITSTLNTDLILWQTQLIVCAENVKSWFKLEWVIRSELTL